MTDISHILDMKNWEPLRLIQHLQGIGLIANSYSCPICNRNMTLLYRRRLSDKYTWYCNRCRVSRSLRKGTWFELSKVKISDILLFTYLFAINCNQSTALQMHRNITHSTFINWCSFCREVCTEVVIREGGPIGGPGRSVEVDLAKFGKRKYNRGGVVDEKWVLGGVERGTGKCFLKVINDRSSETLVTLIKENILPETTVITDCWRGYNNLNEHDYNHLTVNHSLNFRDPDTGAHTNTIVGMWSSIKRKLPAAYRSEEAMTLHLAEFMYRRLRRVSNDMYITFLQDIVRVYPPYTSDPVV